MKLPRGFAAYVGSIGIKDDTDDLLILTATQPPASAQSPAADTPASAVAATGVFTQSLFSGPSVTISRRNIANGTAAAVVIVSKNANVATGAQGAADAEELAQLTAAAVGCEPADVIVGSTGVIGVPYPMPRVRDHFRSLGRLEFQRNSQENSVSAEAAASAIMTTDTHPKTSQAEIARPTEASPVEASPVEASPAETSTARVVGIAKGVGMIEPDMATMIAVITTDATLPQSDAKSAQSNLDAIFKRVVDRTFNALSVDTDTSTSDMAVLLASGAAGPVDPTELEAALTKVCTDLTRQLAADGEGAQTLIVVTVDQARDAAQAKRVAKAIVNSPLVKTAVHGNDPNWGRVAMAIGKCQDDKDINPDEVVIRFGTQEVFPTPATDKALAQLSDYLSQDEVLIHVSLGTGTEAFTVYGCDLTDGYVRINADYTT